MSTTVVRVTGKHIAGGIANSCTRCPIALALCDALTPELLPDLAISVGDLHVSVRFDGATGRRRRHAAMPEEATKFVHAFDLRGHVEPFEFELTWTEVVL